VTATLAVTLPHGMRVGSEWRRDARLRALTGAEEEFLADDGAALPPVERTTALLARCVERLGGAEPSEESIEALTLGDREALLLQLRRLTFGDRLAALVSCPAPGCGERLDLELSVADLLVEPYANDGEWSEASVPDGGAARVVRLRAVTGADQATAARLAPDMEAAARALVERCVGGEGVDAVLARALPGLMAARDPQAEVVLSLSCPACEAPFRVLFDTAEFLQGELAGGRTELYEDVHRLALHYHWSEREILELPTGKRRRYLELLADSFEGARP
jgi:hypothetical protein